jgi:hypothetical protein
MHESCFVKADETSMDLSEGEFNHGSTSDPGVSVSA